MTAYGPSKAPPFPMHANNRAHKRPCSRCGVLIEVNTTRDAAKPGFGVCPDCKESDPMWVVATHDRQVLIPSRTTDLPPNWAEDRRRAWATALGTGEAS